MNDIFTKDLSGEIVSPNEPGYDALIDDIFACMETSQELNTVSIRNQKRVHELMEIILGKNMPESTTLLHLFILIMVNLSQSVRDVSYSNAAHSSGAEVSLSGTTCLSGRNAILSPSTTMLIPTTAVPLTAVR